MSGAAREEGPGPGGRPEGGRQGSGLPPAARHGVRGGGHRRDDLDSGVDGPARAAARPVRHQLAFAVCRWLAARAQPAHRRERGTLAQLLAVTEPVGEFFAEPDTSAGPVTTTVAYVYADDGTYHYSGTNSPAHAITDTRPESRAEPYSNS